MRKLGLRRLIQSENTSWTLPHETVGPGAQLQCSTESHSLRATIEGQQRKTNPEHAGLPDLVMIGYQYQLTRHKSHNLKLEWRLEYYLRL